MFLFKLKFYEHTVFIINVIHNYIYVIKNHFITKMYNKFKLIVLYFKFKKYNLS